MKKIAHLALILSATLSLSAGAVEKDKINTSNLMCELFGIMCPVVISTSSSEDEDGGGGGLEPPQ